MYVVCSSAKAKVRSSGIGKREDQSSYGCHHLIQDLNENIMARAGLAILYPE